MNSQQPTGPSFAGNPLAPGSVQNELQQPPQSPQNPCSAQLAELENATLSLETAVLARDQAQAVVDSCQQRVDAAVEALENCMDEHNVEPNPQAP